jgi:hypothetical protein
VDAVVTAIKADLDAQLAGALAAEPNRLYSDAAAAETPVIDVPPDLVGTEDTASFDLTGTLHYDRAYVARSDVDGRGRDALTPDIPSGKSLVANSIQIEIGAASATSDQMSVQLVVRAAAAAPIDKAMVRDLVAGMTVPQARDALRPIGDVEVDLWPPWLDRLPRLSFRISVDQVAPSPGLSATPSASQ